MADNSIPHSPVGASDRHHLAYLDGLRALGALFVVIHHMYITEWHIFAGQFPRGAMASWTQWILYGHFAVSVFIVLSGFCLMLPVARGDGTLRGGAHTFFRRRVRRIVPPYYAAIVLSLLLLALRHWLEQASAPLITLPNLLTHLTLTHDLSPSTIGGINGAFWSIAVESQIYLVFPLLVFGWRRMGVLPTVLLAVVVAYTGHFLLRETDLRGLTPHYLALFVFGMLGATLAFSPESRWQALRERLPWGRMALLFGGITLGLCAAWGWQVALGVRAYQSDFLLGLCALCVLVAASRPGRNRLRDLFSWRPLAFIGGFAYSLYLIHLPLLEMFWQFGLHPLHLSGPVAYAVFVLIGTPLLVGAAHLFFLGCERPWLSRKS